MMNDSPFDGAPIIHAYTRADAIRDGVLIHVTETAREAGFTLPVAMTVAAWADTVAWDASDNARKRTVQDEAGRLWDAVWMARYAARRASPDATMTEFTLLRVRAKAGAYGLSSRGSCYTSDRATMASRS